MAEVAAAAFIEDDVYGRFMFPHRRDYPRLHHSVRIAYAIKARSCWERIGPGAAARANPLDLRKFAGTSTEGSTGCYSTAPEIVLRTRSTSRCSRTLMPYAAHLWSGGREEAWNLDILCTHPDFEGKKHGSFLVTVGEAEGDGVCTSVIAPWGKFGFKGAGRADVGPIAWVSTIIFRDKITTIIFRDKITRGRRR
ncbi:hypothetical protein VC83_09248 [Pseudogymnoascus destructans]|uniref:Uncharacterized protein n=1 Tax=Pseudogymnoascus destructans TaxID=655981 RepID=A0A176ZX38_9PEZI|nr:uncharacterized protein VC83_09248 [Pseudogymnoascus destructans]OAF54519.1 hypothetical protein VC83_09248 [Pseudogymnoascus destructans]